MKKNFENPDLFYTLDFNFSVIYFSETQADDSFGNNFLCQLKNYNFIHQIKNGRKGGGLSIFVLESFCYNTRKDLCTNNYETEVEIENKRSKNIILSVIYRQPNRDLKVSKIILMITFPKMKKTIRK